MRTTNFSCRSGGVLPYNSLNTTMSRTRMLILVGSSATVLGVSLLGWVNDSARPLLIAEAAGLLLLFSGMLSLIAGCIAFCAKGDANQVLLVGAITSGVALIVIPVLRSLLHFEENVHDWTGLFFFFIWVPACALGPLFVMVGVSRHFLQRRHRQ
jgi:hypothetical protein